MARWCWKFRFAGQEVKRSRWSASNGPCPPEQQAMTRLCSRRSTPTVMQTMRVRVSRQSDGSVLVIGRLLTSYEEANERLAVALLASTLGGLLVIGLLGAWLVGVGLRPLTEVERATAQIDEDDLERRVPGADERTEIGRLSTTINRMLDRLQSAFAQRQRDVAALQESEATMRRFVADASHELRTPIAATAAYAELFERGARDRPDDLARAMAGIRSETARMAALVEDLLFLAQIDEGRPSAEVDVDLAEVVVEAVDAARAVAPEREVRLRLDDVVVVTGDAARLRQVIDNLLSNIRTHTPTETSCQVTVRREGDEAVLVVADDGPGMDPADADRAFLRFHRADVSRTRASGGAGLGLSIVAAIVAAHHGTVELSSQPGAGTTIEVRLPIADRPVVGPFRHRSLEAARFVASGIAQTLLPWVRGVMAGSSREGDDCSITIAGLRRWRFWPRSSGAEVHE